MNTLKYIPFTTIIDVSFWKAIYKLKLEIIKENQDPVSLKGFPLYNIETRPFCVQVNEKSLLNEDLNVDVHVLKGCIKIVNTVQEFNSINKVNYLETVSRNFFNKSLNEFSKIDQFVNVFAICYLDLKKHKNLIWFAYPCISSCKMDSIDFLQIHHVAGKDDDVCFYKKNKKELDAVSVEEYKNILNSGKGKDLVTSFNFPILDNDGVSNWYFRNFLIFLKKCVGSNLSTFHVLSGSKLFKVNIDSHSCDEQVIGWETNLQGKCAPVKVNLSSIFDKATIAQNALQLNLKLIKWNILPEIDLDVIAGSRCVVVGSGTLGCYVARALLAWGVEKITFIDCGSVSFSNPVRQSLYVFKDAVENKKKSFSAAQALKEIHPKVNAQHLDITIPMPGHVFSENEKSGILDDIQRLERVVEENDIIFNLTDSRESRWCMTLLTQVYNKVCITAAIGFSSFLVMRHGARYESHVVNPKFHVGGAHLGCYFCNDVVSLTDTTTNRTLDRQCTVTRPGISLLASGHAVELFTSLVQHPLKIYTPASISQTSQDESLNSCLGVVPHQIRTYLPDYRTITPTTPRFDKCCACSRHVVEKYKQQGHKFILDSVLDPNYLNQVTQLNNDLNKIENLDIDYVSENSE